MAGPGEQTSGAPVRGVLAWGWGRTVAFVLVVSAAGALLVGGASAVVLVPLLRSAVERGSDAVAGSADAAPPGGEVEGVVLYDVPSAQHTESRVDYPQTPPVGGDHLPAWQDCGFYDEPVLAEAVVHSLEHGAIWVTHDPDLPADDVERLRRLAAVNPYLLVSPVRDLPAPVVASGWGVQLALDDADDQRLEPFLASYLQGPQTPEPGAPCWGGLSGTAAEVAGVVAAGPDAGGGPG